MTINSDDFNKWIGKTETTADDVTLAPLNAMAATLDKKFQRFQVGDQILHSGTGLISWTLRHKRSSLRTGIQNEETSYLPSRYPDACGRVAAYIL